MTVPRLSARHRHGCRVVGASFVAAAALPLLAGMPLAQASPGHGPADNHVAAMERAAAQPAKPAQAAKPAQHNATKPAAKEHGQQKVVICHATNSDTNPYVVIVVSVASVKYQGHLAHATHPNKTWKHDTSWNGTTYQAGAAKPDRIGKVGGTRADLAFCTAHGITPPVTTPPVTTPPVTTPPVTTPPVTTPPAGNPPAVEPPVQVLPTKFTSPPSSNIANAGANASTSATSANAGVNTQVLGEKVSALPRTGADMVGAALLSLLLLTVGGLLLRLSAVRRRRTH